MKSYKFQIGDRVIYGEHGLGIRIIKKKFRTVDGWPAYRLEWNNSSYQNNVYNESCLTLYKNGLDKLDEIL